MTNSTVESVASFFSCGTVQAKRFVDSVIAGDLPGLEFKEENNTDDVRSVIDYLNLKTGKRYKNNTPAHTRIIKARFSEGFTKDDMVTVIDNMVSAWGSDPKMSQYLRPATLFQASKFDGYLNRDSMKNRGKNLFDELG